MEKSMDSHKFDCVDDLSLILIPIEAAAIQDS